ncbi:MAG: VTT domain-containing protein [Clostridia bacterium]
MNKEKRNKIVRLSVFIFLVVMSVIIIAYSIKEIAEVIRFMNEFEYGDKITLHKIFKHMGVKGIMAYVALQVLFVLTIVIPSTPLQILAGLSYPPIIASGILMLGIGIGSVALFLLSRLIGYEFFNVMKKNKKNALFFESMDAIQSNHTNLVLFAIILYLLPILPYGLICILMGNSKIRTWQFALVCTFSSFLDVIVNTSLGNQLGTGNPIMTTIAFVVFFAVVGLFIANTKRIFEWVKKIVNTKKEEIQATELTENVEENNNENKPQ